MSSVWSRVLRSLRPEAADASPFVAYRPPARDSFSIPPHVLYVTAGLVLVLLATYAIVGHLIEDLLHDLADWVFGPKADGEADEEKQKAGPEEERCDLLPGLSQSDPRRSASSLHYITSL